MNQWTSEAKQLEAIRKMEDADKYWSDKYISDKAEGRNVAAEFAYFNAMESRRLAREWRDSPGPPLTTHLMIIDGGVK